MLTALWLLAATVIGRLIPQRGVTILWALVFAGIGSAIFLKPQFGVYLMVGLIPLTKEIMLVEDVSTIRLLGIVTLGAWLLRKIVRREPLTVLLSGSLVPPILAFALLAGASVLWSASLDLWASMIPTLLRLVLWYFMLVDLITSWKGLRSLMLVMLATGLWSIAIGIYRFYFLDFERARGGYGTADGFSSLVLVLLPIAFYFVSHESKLQRLLGLLSIASGIVALGASMTRTTLLVALFLPPLQFFEWRRLRQRMVISVVVVTLIVMLPLLPWDRIGHRMAQLMAGDEITTIGGRVFRWRIAVMEFLEHPFLGVGYNNYGAHYYRYEYALQVGPPYVVTTTDRFSAGFRTDQRVVPHSLYSGILAELGMVGIVTLIWLLVTSLRIISQAIKEAGEGTQQKDRWLLIALRISLICYLLYSFALSTEDSKLLWLLLALTEVAHKLVTPSSEDKLVPGRLGQHLIPTAPPV
jgi:O-antigen ligase